jgi:hypothetical protein
VVNVVQDDWDSMLSGFDGLESDLSDFADPDNFETMLDIDEQGRLLSWLEDEARLASPPAPSLEIPTLPPVAADFIGFGEKSGFGSASVMGRSSVEKINNRLGVEAETIGAMRSEQLGFEAMPSDAAELLESSQSGADFMAAVSAAKPSEADNEFADFPVMNLLDAVEGKKPKAAPTVSQPEAEVSSLPEIAVSSLPEVAVIPEPKAVPLNAPEPVVSSLPEPVVSSQPPAASMQVASPSAPMHLRTAQPQAAPYATTMRRYFDATDLLEAQSKLVEILGIPQVPLVVFLGRAAERCSQLLPDVSSIALAQVAEEGLVNMHLIGAHESFRKVLLEINDSKAEPQADLTVADLSELELDEVSLPLQTPHLLLTRLTPDPERPQRLRGTLTLTGAIGLKSGAAFLKAVVTRLESPITLML